jgi:hypothetical protein
VSPAETICMDYKSQRIMAEELVKSSATRYTFLIDADADTSYFDAALYAYVTGDRPDLESLHAMQVRELFAQEKQIDPNAASPFRRFIDYRGNPAVPFEIVGSPQREARDLGGQYTLGIYLREFPPEEVVNEWKERSVRFCLLKRCQFEHTPHKILGFRLLTETTVVMEKAL